MNYNKNEKCNIFSYYILTHTKIAE